MYRDDELAHLNGQISIDEYTDGQAYTVFGSIQDAADYEAQQNAAEKATGPTLGVIKRVGICKNGNVWVAVRRLDRKTALYFLSKVECDGLGILLPWKETYKTSPKGIKVQTGWSIEDTKALGEELTELYKDVEVTLYQDKITEVWK